MSKFNYADIGSSYITESEEQNRYRESSIELSQVEFTTIREFTEGWKPAVELVTHFLVEQGPSFLANINLFLSNWIENVALQRYTRKEINLISCLSLLENFSPELVCHISGWNSGVLSQLMTESPLTRLDEKTRRFRYASSILPFIEQHQVMVDNKEKERFLIQAGEWFERRDQKTEAVMLYRKANAYKKIIPIMQDWDYPNSRENAHCFVSIINDMPPSLVHKNPILTVILGHMLNTLYRYSDAVDILERFCLKHDHGAETNSDISAILGEAYLCWASAATCLLDSQEKIVRLCKKASEFLPGESTFIKGKANMFGDTPALRMASIERNSLQEHIDSLREVEPLLMEMTGGGWAGSYHLALAERAYYTKNFEDVESNVQKSIVRALENEQYDIVCSGCFLLMRLGFAQANYQKATENYQLLEHYASEANYDAFFSLPDIAQSFMALRLGGNYHIADWIKDESLYQKKILPFNYGRDKILRATYLLLDKQYYPLLAHIDSSLELFKKRGLSISIIHLYVYQAIAWHRLGDPKKSVKSFEQAYLFSHKNKLIMPVVESGQYLEPVIENCKHDENCIIPIEWLEEIGKKAGTFYVYFSNMKKQYTAQTKSGSFALSNLTYTEQRLLLLISRGIKAKEIAEIEKRSLSSIKGMTRRLYLKIGAYNKADATRIATECGIEEFFKTEDKS